jgi:hypothetical protein
MANERILVVEDERAVARGLAYGLRDEGFEVLVARTGEEALAPVISLEHGLASGCGGEGDPGYCGRSTRLASGIADPAGAGHARRGAVDAARPGKALRSNCRGHPLP